MLGWEGELPEPSVRTIEDMRSVLAEPECACEAPLYFMYRDLARSEADWQWLHDHHLRYDLTVIPPRDICGEYVKTKGITIRSTPMESVTRKFMKCWKVRCTTSSSPGTLMM